MPITIKGITIEEVRIHKDAEHGGFKVEGATYSLISSMDKVLAKQPIGSYGVPLEPSTRTAQALDTFMESYKADVLAVLGLADCS